MAKRSLISKFRSLPVEHRIAIGAVVVPALVAIGGLAMQWVTSSSPKANVGAHDNRQVDSTNRAGRSSSQINLGQSQIRDSQITINQNANDKPAESTNTKLIEFQQIDIDEAACQWTSVVRPYRVEAPDRNIDGKPWSSAKPAIGIPQSNWPLGCHQLSDLHSTATDQIDRTTDPIFSIVLTNRSERRVTLTALGVLPVAAWTSMKASPCATKLRDFDSIVIKMKGFDPESRQMVKLDDPVSFGADETHRIKVKLLGYGEAVKHNESAIRFVAQVNQEDVLSESIYLGLCNIHDDSDD